MRRGPVASVVVAVAFAVAATIGLRSVATPDPAVAQEATSSPGQPAACTQAGMFCVQLTVDNDNQGLDSDGLYVTLVGNNSGSLLSSDGSTTVPLSTSTPFSTFATADAPDTAQMWVLTQQGSPLAGGRLYLSTVPINGTQPGADAPYRYDYVEFTLVYANGVRTINGDVTGIDQVGIPARMEFLDAAGNVMLEAGSSSSYAERSMAGWSTIYGEISGQAQALGLPGFDVADVERCIGYSSTRSSSTFGIPCSEWSPSSLASASPVPSPTPSTTEQARLRLAGPAWMPGGYADYPSFADYLSTLTGKTVRITGYFGGNSTPPMPAAYYDYRGTFDANGNLALWGTLSSDKAGATPAPAYHQGSATTDNRYQAPQPIYIPAASLVTSMSGTTWYQPQGSATALPTQTPYACGDVWSACAYGTGTGVYGQNGPYQLGGLGTPSPSPTPSPTATIIPTPSATASDGSWEYTLWPAPTAVGQPAPVAPAAGPQYFYNNVGNDIYGWIYGDLVASLANGYMGPLGYDTSAWNTNADASGTPYAAAQQAFSGLYPAASPAPTTGARWDLWQQAIAMTSDSYGVSLGDRFALPGKKNPDMATGTDTAGIRVTLLANDGDGPSLNPPRQVVRATAGTPLTVGTQQGQPSTVAGTMNEFEAIGFSGTVAYTLLGPDGSPVPTTTSAPCGTPTAPAQTVAGLCFSSSTGVLSGTATSGVSGIFTVSAQVGGGGDTASAQLTLKVTGAGALTPPTVTITGQVGQAITAAPPTGFATGGLDDPTFAIAPIGDAPDWADTGLTIDQTTGTITGTPVLQMPLAQYLVTATDGTGQATATVTLTIDGPRALTPNPVPSLVGTVGTAVAPTPSLTPVDFEDATAVQYSIQGSPRLYGLVIDPDTGVVSGTPTAAISTTVTILGTDPVTGHAASTTLPIAVTAQTPTITPPTQVLPAVTVGQYLSSQALTLAGAGPTATFAQSGGPTLAGLGLELDATSGVITPIGSGATSATNGRVTIAITGTGSAGSAQATVSLNVLPRTGPTPSPTPTATATPTPTPTPTPTSTGAAWCSPATQTITVTAGSYLATAPLTIGAPAAVFDLSDGGPALPAGLSGPVPSTGVITGKPSMPGTTTVQVVCMGANGYQAFASITFAIGAPSTPTPTAIPTPTPTPTPTSTPTPTQSPTPLATPAVSCPPGFDPDPAFPGGCG